MNSINISFDFDGTLRSNIAVQSLASMLSNTPSKYNLFIITRRYCDGFEDVEVIQFANSLDIPKERVIFTNREYKRDALVANRIDVHIDDDSDELAFIRYEDDVYVLCTINSYWINDFWKIINDTLR